MKDKVHVCHQAAPREVLRCALELGVNQIIQDTNPHYLSQLSSSLEMAEHPGLFFEHPFCVTLTPKSISAENERKLIFHDVTFNKTADKDQLLIAVEAAVTSLARPQSLLYDVKLVADELIMNALYNAPMSAQSAKVDRSVNVELPSNKICRLALARDGERLVLVCEDPFGTLNIPTYLAGLSRCYEDGVKKAMNWGKGGAGIGCYMIFESCMSLYLAVKPSEKTVVACVFALGKGTRARQEMSKSVHYTNL